MNPEVLYQWSEVIGEALGLGKRQAKRLSVFSVGVVWSERCTLSKVGERLAGVLGIQMDSVQRRLQRTLEDVTLKRKEIQRAWAKWVLSRVDSREYVLLVDETRLGEHLNVMMVGLAYQSRCIPLAWVCYPPETPGQVKRIERLLKQVKSGMPTEGQVVVEAERGIGTSPDLVRVVRRLGWHYLFRVQGQTKLITRDGHEHTLGDQTSGWSAYGLLFKQRGRVRGYALVYQDFAHDEPWCLITDDPSLSVLDYALRNWQEQAFRDLKSGGWNWQRSQVWRPDHAAVLVLVLALAYAWVLSLGTLVAHAERPLRARIVRGAGRLYSIFREGLRYWLDLVGRRLPVYLGLFFAPDKLLT
jgi:Transposase DDE domain